MQLPLNTFQHQKCIRAGVGGDVMRSSMCPYIFTESPKIFSAAAVVRFVLNSSSHCGILSSFSSLPSVREILSWEDIMSETDEIHPPPPKKPRLEGEESSDESKCHDDAGSKDQNEAATVDLPKEVGAAFTRIKRRKFAVLLSYNGKGYKGMQWNPGFPTVEADLLAAMCKAVAFPKDMAGDLGKIKFQRCARTDKELDDPPAQINAHLPPQVRVVAAKRVTKGFDARHACSGRMYEYLLPTYVLAPYHQTKRDYRVPDETVAYLDRLLAKYEGTRNYHNFTSGKKYDEMSSKRYITSFKSESKFVAGDASNSDLIPLEFLPLRVRGQSFVLHQIRKMIGFVVAIIRGYLKETDFESAFLEEKVDIPRAPSLGLLLDNVYFDHYNARYANSGERERLEWDKYAEEVNKFKKEHIHRTIVETELREMPMMQWLHTLQIHDFHGTAQRLKDAETAKSCNEGTPTTLASNSEAQIPSKTEGIHGSKDEESNADKSGCNPTALPEQTTMVELNPETTECHGDNTGTTASQADCELPTSTETKLSSVGGCDGEDTQSHSASQECQSSSSTDIVHSTAEAVGIRTSEL